jgi:hypothetical protein
VKGKEGEVLTDVTEREKEVDDGTHVRLAAVWTTGESLSGEEGVKDVLTESSAEAIGDLYMGKTE